MGRKKKYIKWFPADPLRIRAFAYSLVPAASGAQSGRKIKAKDVQLALEGCSLKEPLSDATINYWLTGKKRPSSENIKDIELTFPGCADWLEPDIESSPIRRFLCALDIWGSPIDSPVRKLDTASAKITVGSGLAILAKRWASIPINAGPDCFCGFAIPRLKCKVPDQVSSTIYQSRNILTLMDFMFRCGSYLELSEEEFREWAIDLASLTILIGAFFEGIPFAEQLQPGATGVYNSLAYRIFFRGHGNWPNVESVRGELQDFSEFEDSIIDYPIRLMQAREELRKELLSIGSELSIVEVLFDCIKDRNRMWKEPLGTHGETFSQSELLRVKRNISPAAPGRYRYELRYLSGDGRAVLCHDLENGAQAPLRERPDLYDGYPGSFNWGYSGSGPTFLTISILAHHLGHDNFGFEEINRLLDKYISRFIVHRFMGPKFLTTELIDRCLNE